MQTLSFANAITGAIAAEMRTDPRVFFMSTNPAAELEREFGSERVRRTPIAESTFAGIGVGAALSGYRPVVGLSNVAFSFSAFDQLVNQAAKATYMFGDQACVPAVFLAAYHNGTQSAAQHSQTGYAMYAHAGSLKVVTPSTPADAWGLLTTAIRSDDPVMFVYATKQERLEESVADVLEPTPFGHAVVRRAGTDVTVVGVVQTVGLALEAAARLAAEGVSAEVIDPRTLVPLDVETIRTSVQKTGRLVVVDESFPICSIAAEILSCVCEDDRTFAQLSAPVRRVCNRAVPVPYNPALEEFVLPSVDRVVAAVRDVVGVLMPGGN